MQIIVVSGRLSTVKSLTLSTRHLVVLGVAFVALVLGLAMAISYVTVRHAADVRLPVLQELVAEAQQAENQRIEDKVRDSLKAIAQKVGQLQAQLLHLDSLGDRLSAVAGLKPAEIKVLQESSADSPAGSKAAKGVGGQGGPLLPLGTVPISAEDLGHELDRLLTRTELHADYMAVVESALMDKRILRGSLPTVLPVDTSWNSSAYGWRSDPFTGLRSMHEGVDFSAEIGTPIVAAANGVVTGAERTPDYGLLVEIDHGNGYTTRYAHASVLHVNSGQIVKRGQLIAEVGNTGRSTGPHLHFEVRYLGKSVNPARFLPRKGDTSGRGALARR